MSYDCITEISEYKNKDFALCLQKVTNINKDRSKLTCFLNWIKDPRFLNIFERIEKDQQYLDFDQLNKVMP